MTVDPEIPVPPILYGGIERIIDMLVRELQERGHEVHLFANPKSTVSTNLAPYVADNSLSRRDTLENALFVRSYLNTHGPFDVIHSFARLAYLLPLLPMSIPKIQSYQRAISPRSVRLGRFLSHGTLTFTSCSSANAASVRHITNRWMIIHNGVDTSKYQFVEFVAQDAPLVFLGRIERIKGVHTAIEVARRTGRRLLIAGNHAAHGEHAEYFKHEVLPYCNGNQIDFIGQVDDVQKNALLGNAAALLFPIEWEEPFGIVMAEAFACGTPVIGLRRGSVPEVIDHSVTGFICDDLESMSVSVTRLSSINRLNCRLAAEQRFSHSAITDQYELLYRSLIPRSEPI